MTDTQLYFAIGIPVFTFLVAFAGTMIQVNTINARITGLESSLNARMTSLENSLNGRMSRLEERFESLIGKVVDVDTRLSRLEDRLDLR